MYLPDENTPMRIPLGFGGLSASIGDHIAHFYKGVHQRFSVLGPYIAEGLGREDKCVVICSPQVADQLCEWLESRDLDVAEARRVGLLILHPGEGSREKMKALAERLEEESLGAGHDFVRWAGDMAWGLGKKISASELLRWEALYDECSQGWRMCALCQYDLTQFGGDMIVNALRSHPLCIMGEALVPNPLHMPPEILLQQLTDAR